MESHHNKCSVKDEKTFCDICMSAKNADMKVSSIAFTNFIDSILITGTSFDFMLLITKVGYPVSVMYTDLNIMNTEFHPGK